MAAVIDKKTVLRDKRAQGIAAMGLVKREGDRFSVSTPSLRGRRTAYEVWRDEAGKVRCSCLEFEEQSAQDSAFRCEHILAVKHSLVARNTETAAQPEPIAAAVKPSIETGGAEVGSLAAASTNTEENASEKLSVTRANSSDG
nr:SWIM zinc finger family protein [Pyrinomonadaceae bacterium]